VGPGGQAAAPRAAGDFWGFALLSDLPSILSAPETAALFGRDIRTLSNWEKAGLLIPVRINRRRFFRVSDIKKLLGVDQSDDAQNQPSSSLE